VVEDPKVMTKRLQDEAAEARAQLAKTTEMLLAMQTRLDAMEAEKKTPAKGR
jgi:hypothetical protein